MNEEDMKITIMVVDDEQEIRERLKKTLMNAGYEVMLAESGPDCMKQLESTIPDLMLLDIFMSPWDGWRTLEEIKNNPEIRNISILMLTVAPLTMEDFECDPITTGKFDNVEDYLVKPINREDLLKAVSDITGFDEYLNKILYHLTQNGEEMRGRDFAIAAKQLYRNMKLKHSLVKCLLDVTGNEDRVRKILEERERNIQTSRFKIRTFEDRYIHYGVKPIYGR